MRGEPILRIFCWFETYILRQNIRANLFQCNLDARILEWVCSIADMGKKTKIKAEAEAEAEVD